MFQMLTAVPIVLGLCFTFYRVIELYARRKERLLMIEKLNSMDGTIPDLSAFCLPIKTPNLRTFSALKIGLLLMGLGVGLVLALFVNVSAAYGNTNSEEITYFAFMMIGGGLGLVTAWIIEQRVNK